MLERVRRAPFAPPVYRAISGASLMRTVRLRMSRALVIARAKTSPAGRSSSTCRAVAGRSFPTARRRRWRKRRVHRRIGFGGPRFNGVAPAVECRLQPAADQVVDAQLIERTVLADTQGLDEGKQRVVFDAQVSDELVDAKRPAPPQQETLALRLPEVLICVAAAQRSGSTGRSQSPISVPPTFGSSSAASICANACATVRTRTVKVISSNKRITNSPIGLPKAHSLRQPLPTGY